MHSLLGHLPVVNDFPRPGVGFRDISPLLADPRAFAQALDGLAQLAAQWPCTQVAGIESRGLVFATALATRLGLGLILLRKPGKLPPPVLRESYDLEYGHDALEIQPARVTPGARVLLVDDVIATGGTLLAGARLVRKAGGEVAGALALLEIAALPGGKALRAAGVPVATLLAA
jgi:adenine phosphoribosyltransferase